MSSFIWPTTNAVPVYSSLSVFPSTANTGQLAIAADTGILYEWFGGAWTAISGTGSVLSVGTFGSTPNTKGLDLTANVLTLEPADGTHPGALSTGAQTIGGAKTFSSTISASNLSGTNTGDVTLGTANGLSLSLQALSLGLSSTSTTGALSSADWNTFNNKQSALTLGNLTDVGTDGITVTGGTGSVVGSGTSLSQHVADSTHNGYLSSTDWSTFNNKQSTLTLGNLTDAGTDGITVTNGTGVVVGSGTSLSQHVADATHNGYLSSADWSTFNGKQASGSYITALTGDVAASGPGSSAATLATVNSNVGSFTNASITVNGKGLITAASNGATFTPVAPTVQKFLSGSGTYTRPTGPTPLYIRVVMAGPGGGGAGSGSAADSAGSDGSTATVFGSSLLVANIGKGGDTSLITGQGGVGGTASLGSGPVGIAVPGGTGQSCTQSSTVVGGIGGTNVLGGGSGGILGAAGRDGGANTGAGGGGSGTSTTSSGSGGGAGGYIDAIITSPATTYSYTVGVGGAGGSAGTGGFAGGAGADGVIIVYEYYQ